MSVLSALLVKLPLVKPRTGTFTTRSQYFSLACARRLTSLPMERSITSMSVRYCVSVPSSKSNFTPMTMSAPKLRATSAAKLFFAPPSTSTMLPMCTGENTPGMDMLLRRLWASLPWVSTTSSSVMRLVATHANWRGRSRKKLMLSL